MKKSWYMGFDNDEQKKGEIRAHFKEARPLRQQLKHILEHKMNESLKSRRLEQAYDSPNWAYIQADCSGYERALAEVLDLIEDEKSK